MNDLKQKGHIAELKTPLGDDRLVLSRLDAHEGLSEVFEFTVEALSTDENINFDDAIGKNCCVKVKSRNDVNRFFNGVLAEAQWLGVRDDLYAYRLVLRPWLWLLSFTNDCRFFQDKSVKDIIEQVFQEAGFSDFELKLTQSYEKLEYCVQYRETHFSFVCRLMEEYGIYYYFKHTQDKHVLILADNATAHQKIDAGDLHFWPLSGAYVRDSEHLQQWSSERRFRTGKVALTDYDFKKPTASMGIQAQASESYEKATLEVFDYPGRYVNPSVGETLAKVRLQAAQAADHRRYAAGEAQSAVPGGKFTLKGHSSDAENIEYLIVRCSHTAVVAHYRSGGGEGEYYRGSYTVMPNSRPFRAPSVTPKPLIHGIQTAKVVGDSGEEITVDEYGRIKVQFYWDRKKKQSCWIRVAEKWSGRNWGSSFHPRHGMEVIVDFLEGDPDRPLVVGTVYNADNTRPYSLPAKKNMNGWKSDSTKGGGGYNEFVFDDTKGSELIRMHGQKDHEVKILHSEKVEIGEVFPVPKGQSSRTHTIKMGDDELNVSSGDRKVTIAMDHKLQVGMNQDISIGISKSESIGATSTLNVGATRSATIGATDSTTAGASISRTAGASISDTAGASFSITAGASVTVMAPAGITLMAGGTVVMLTPAGIIINAPTFLMNAMGTLINSSTIINGKSPIPPIPCGKLIVG